MGVRVDGVHRSIADAPPPENTARCVDLIDITGAQEDEEEENDIAKKEARAKRRKINRKKAKAVRKVSTYVHLSITQ